MSDKKDDKISDKSEDKNVNGAEMFFQYKIHIPTRTLYLGPSQDSEEDTDHNMTERAIIGLHILDNLEYPEGEEEPPITIKMRNHGGCVTEGFAIYDEILECKAYVHIIVCGTASSMGSVILQAGDKRIIRPNAYIMIHDGEDSGSWSTKKSRKNWEKFGDEQDEKCYDIYLDKIQKVNPDFTKSKLKSMMIHDTILNSEKALELGLVDEIG